VAVGPRTVFIGRRAWRFTALHEFATLAATAQHVTLAVFAQHVVCVVKMISQRSAAPDCRRVASVCISRSHIPSGRGTLEVAAASDEELAALAVGGCDGSEGPIFEFGSSVDLHARCSMI
jgi:hypothetical protein